jgi:hypothetical protein
MTDTAHAPYVEVEEPRHRHTYGRCLADLLPSGQLIITAVDGGAVVQDYQAGSWNSAVQFSADGEPQQFFQPHASVAACSHCSTLIDVDGPPRHPMRLCDSCWREAVQTQGRKADRGAA